MNKQTKRPVILITGASRGIGAATAVGAAKRGYDVCINYTSEHERAEQVAKTCQSYGARTCIVQADVSDEGAVKALFEQCDVKLGMLEVLVNNAGIVGCSTRLEHLAAPVLEKTFAVNVYGTVYCTQQAVRRMSTESGGKGGCVVNVSSIASTLGSAGEYVHYAASKGAVDSLTIGLSKELGGEGIRVNAVLAGTAQTEIHERSGNAGRPAMVAKNAPLGRVAAPEDIANAILWLASSEAGYATGALLRVGGGL